MEFDDKVPIYYQIKQYICREIITGHLQAGSQVPAVRQLALDLTVNVNTIQRALTELNQDGVLVTKRGRGNFVTEDIQVLTAMKQQVVQAALSSTYDQLSRLGITPQEMVTALTTYIERREETTHE